MSVSSVDPISAIRLRRAEDDRRRALDPAPRQKRRAPTPEASALPIEIAFLSGRAPDEVLRYAAALARRQGVCADEALIAEGLMDEAAFYRALAAHIGVAFLGDGFTLAPDGDASDNFARGYARLEGDPDGRQWLFAPTGRGIARIIGAARAARGRPLFAITTRTAFRAALTRDAREEALAAASSAERVEPSLCARPAIESRLAAPAILIGFAFLAALFAPVDTLSRSVAVALALLFLASSFLRLFACAASLEREEPRLWLADAALPVYTVVVALYREAAVARQIAMAMDRLDYPRAKLDVKFVVEDDDVETTIALRAALRPHQEMIVAPPGEPRTKPRALNVAMRFARGELVAVYDAEDLPHPRQLRRAAALFARAPQSLGCLQASLVVDNAFQNPLTALYAIDYAALFDVFNKGLAALKLPLFLGGTSNHFRMTALRHVGFWDAWNVTEDVDLGLRLARAGFSVETFACETGEEAPGAFSALLRQRTRWLKGWMLTALVHMRNPRRFIADFGAQRAAAVFILFANGFAGPLLGPLLALKFGRDALFGTLLTPTSPSEAAFGALWCYVALCGTAALLWPLAVGMRRRGLVRYWPALAAWPIWSAMLTLAAGRALWQLWKRPAHWDKTEHGLAPRRATRRQFAVTRTATA